MSNYILEDKIGKGVYGDVYRARHKQSQQVVAIKKIRKQDCDQGISSVAIREASVLKTIQHPNIIELVEIELIGGSIRLVMKYYEQDLENLLQTEQQYDPKKLILGILRGVDACHKKKCMHRDLKPQNILIDENQEARIGDFGMARIFQRQPNPFTSDVITLWYRPPELLLGHKSYSTAVDVWSVGCIFAQILTRQVLFPGDSEIDQLKKISDQFVKISDNQERIRQLEDPKMQEKLNQTLRQLVPDDKASDLLINLLQLNPQKRISCRDAIAHPYFGGIEMPVEPQGFQDPILRKYIE